MSYYQTVYDTLHQMNLFSIFFRVTCAIIVGTVVGLDRGKRGRVAGFKTHTIVCLGATLAMLTGEYISAKYGENGDIARIGAQVISGVGFLGVGTIIVTGHNQVKGLTTAASLWTCSCIGLALGIGFYSGAFAVCVAVVFVLLFGKVVDDYIAKRTNILELYIEFESSDMILGFMENAKMSGIKILSLEIQPAKIRKDSVAILTTVEAEHNKRRDDILTVVRDVDGIVMFEEL